MSDDKQAIKMSFHIPAAESHVAELLQVVCAATGNTPSNWVYGTLVKRLQEVGLLDGNRQIVRAAFKELQGSLPPGLARKTIQQSKN